MELIRTGIQLNCCALALVAPVSFSAESQNHGYNQFRPLEPEERAVIESARPLYPYQRHPESQFATGQSVNTPVRGYSTAHPAFSGQINSSPEKQMGKPLAAPQYPPRQAAPTYQYAPTQQAGSMTTGNVYGIPEQAMPQRDGSGYAGNGDWQEQQPPPSFSYNGYNAGQGKNPQQTGSGQNVDVGSWQHATGGYSFSGQAAYPRQPEQYHFRTLSDATPPPVATPTFRPDERFGGEKRRGENKSRWTGNDVIAPPASEQVIPRGNQQPGWQGSSGYGYPAVGGYPTMAPPRSYDNNRRHTFPFPGGFMPTFNW